MFLKLSSDLTKNHQWTPLFISEPSALSRGEPTFDGNKVSDSRNGGGGLWTRLLPSTPGFLQGPVMVKLYLRVSQGGLEIVLGILGAGGVLWPSV